MDLLNLLRDDPRFPLLWQMSRAEQLTLIAMMERIRPRVSLEIGAYRGGSLQVLSHYSHSVTSLDINPDVVSELGGKFDNVEFRIGNSKEVLPTVIAEMNTSRETPNFILIDGDHTAEGVRSDIEDILDLKPSRDCFIILHDSFNPPCREGMIAAAWERSPYVQAVDLDFLCGDFSRIAPGSMWGGFGCAYLKPAGRLGSLEVQQSHRPVFDACVPFWEGAKHRPPAKAQSARRRVIESIRQSLHRS